MKLFLVSLRCEIVENSFKFYITISIISIFIVIFINEIMYIYSNNFFHRYFDKI
jgi:hypothetical protein